MNASGCVAYRVAVSPCSFWGELFKAVLLNRRHQDPPGHRRSGLGEAAEVCSKARSRPSARDRQAAP